MAHSKKTPLSILAIRIRDDLVLSGKSSKTVKAYLAAARAVDQMTAEQV